MMIGKNAGATTAISTADAQSVTVRGRDLCSDLMGRVGFTDYFCLLLTGREPTENQRFFLDLLLVAIAEHGLVPTNQVARMTYDADPSALQAAVAAGILGCGSVVLGTAQSCGEFLIQARRMTDETRGDPATTIRDLVAEIRREGGKVPGFGHPLHKPVDPRAQRILDLAEERTAGSPYVALARVAATVVPEAWGKPLPMNVSMAIAAVLLDLEFPAGMLKAIPILARTASLLAHLGEEQKNPIGFLMAHHAENAITYEERAS
ncbi:citryl-CoA lyase [Oricola nitratireducens]|uniref:citryl-CoA lyase n=1 Tax=Oricola nitratireducens TaxID=2775868 RepID=UPI0018668BC7|nr:citryl-CoA lyase [Oricola nitratireducens]